MFTKLQHDATAIDIGVNSLRSKLPAVMTGYTYNDLDGETVLDERRSLADDTATTLRQFEGRAQRFEDLLTQMVANNAETERQLVTMASEFGLERCLHVTDEVDENDDDANGDEPAAEEKNNDVITKRESEEEDGSGIVQSAQNSPCVVFFRANDHHETPALPSRSTCRILKPKLEPNDEGREQSLAKSLRRLNF